MHRASILIRLCAASLSIAIGCTQNGRLASLDHPDALGDKDLFADTPRTGGRSAPELTDKSGLGDYLQYAALNSPVLEAAFNRWKADLQQIPQVTVLPDPKFTYQYYIHQVETRVGAQRQALGIAQTFPWLGKLELRGDAAAQAANASYQRYQQAKLKLFYEVTDAYCEYYYLEKAIEITRQNIQLLKHIESIARIRYKAAAAGHPDVIRAQIELGKLDDRISALRDMRRPLVARLNAAMNRPSDAPLVAPKEIETPAVEIGNDGDKLLAAMLKNNPELKALDRQAESRKIAIDLAKKNYFPDVTLGMSYIDTANSTGGRRPSDDGNDPLIAMVSINLPIWREKLDAGVRQARYRHRTVLQTRAAKANSLSAKLKMIVYRYRDAQRKVSLYRDTLLPKARQAVTATDAVYRTGKGSFLDLIDAQRVLLEFEITLHRAVANRAQRLGELEMVTGVRPGPEDSKGDKP